MSVGSRISHSGFLGTIRYVGEVAGTTGCWLGVEWDDPTRGKHSGEHQGKVYFQCRVPLAGSFIRQTTATSFGVSFRRALEDKYLDSANPSQGDAESNVEIYLLGSSSGAIEIEAPNFDRVRKFFSQIERLKELSLDGEGVSSIEADDDLRKWCRNIQGLNMSRNLFADWCPILVSLTFLPSLKLLNLDCNRFQVIKSFLPTVSSPVAELRLNGTLISWQELPYLGPAFPSLEALQVGFNLMERLSPWEMESSLASTLTILYLDGNLLGDWVNFVEAVSGITGLQRVSLSSNVLVEVPRRDDQSAINPLGNLKHLVLSSNRISSWISVDAVREWCCTLESLGISDNPVTAVGGSTVRASVIARLPTLTTLDGATIRRSERRDAELFYLTHIANSIEDEEQRKREHPQWEALCSKHGRPDVVKAPKNGTMAERMINVHLHQLPQRPTSSNILTADMVPESATSIRILPSMPIRALHMKILKLLKVTPARRKNALLWAIFKRADESWLAVELPLLENREADWYGVEDACGIGVWA